MCGWVIKVLTETLGNINRTGAIFHKLGAITLGQYANLNLVTFSFR